MVKRRKDRVWSLGCAWLALALAACATTQATPTGLYAMPADLSRALSPSEADPSRAAELAESALYLLNPERPETGVRAEDIGVPPLRSHRVRCAAAGPYSMGA